MAMNPFQSQQVRTSFWRSEAVAMCSWYQGSVVEKEGFWFICSYGLHRETNLIQTTWVVIKTLMTFQITGWLMWLPILAYEIKPKYNWV